MPLNLIERTRARYRYAQQEVDDYPKVPRGAIADKEVDVSDLLVSETDTSEDCSIIECIQNHPEELPLYEVVALLMFSVPRLDTDSPYAGDQGPKLTTLLNDLHKFSEEHCYKALQCRYASNEFPKNSDFSSIFVQLVDPMNKMMSAIILHRDFPEQYRQMAIVVLNDIQALRALYFENAQLYNKSFLSYDRQTDVDWRRVLPTQRRYGPNGLSEVQTSRGAHSQNSYAASSSDSSVHDSPPRVPYSEPAVLKRGNRKRNHQRVCASSFHRDQVHALYSQLTKIEGGDSFFFYDHLRGQSQSDHASSSSESSLVQFQMDYASSSSDSSVHDSPPIVPYSEPTVSNRAPSCSLCERLRHDPPRAYSQNVNDSSSSDAYMYAPYDRLTLSEMNATTNQIRRNTLQPQRDHASSSSEASIHDSPPVAHDSEHMVLERDDGNRDHDRPFVQPQNKKTSSSFLSRLRHAPPIVPDSGPTAVKTADRGHRRDSPFVQPQNKKAFSSLFSRFRHASPPIVPDSEPTGKDRAPSCSLCERLPFQFIQGFST